FSANSKLRPLVLPHELRSKQTLQLPLAQLPETKNKRSNNPRLGWAKLLKRVFDVDLSHCQICQSQNVKIIAPILKKEAIEKILSHLSLPTQAQVLHPPRPPPQENLFDPW